MRRGWIALVMVGLSLILGGVEYFTVTSGVDRCIAMLDEADRHIANNEIADAQSTAERLDRRFAGESVLFDIFMYHSEVSTIANDLAMLRRYAETGEISEFLATSAKAKHELIALKNSKQLRLENVF